MKVRRTAAAVLAAGGLAIGAVSLSAPAASAASVADVSAQAAPSWHLAGSYPYKDQCVRTGFRAVTSGGIVQSFRCELAGSEFALYLYY
ncbi:hypothetical protein [Planomonospora sp. ID82291]|uniref:hypothetical protein n=1 Tax=Planomonospora sp. ID82291 TaxID=2738136 RepID=UPI0018C379E9|nr:hypothetical protein [Planomonospora sp. ID82291]MBG0816847.1 hypothetical protein [Planomonospora sp. ID82291]